MQNDVSRRDFLRTGSAGAMAAGALSATAIAADKKASGSNDRIRIGFIGPGGRGFGAHVRTLAKLRQDGHNIDLVAVSEVYDANRDKAMSYIKKETGTQATRYDDYQDMLADKNVDAVCIGTPDHWHARQIIDSLRAGKHVYCEKPMTKTVQESLDVVSAWKSAGKVMQVGVQSTSLAVWDEARELINAGKLGKVLQIQTEYFRNSNMGQWRYYSLTKDMSPKTIDWKRWLGVKEGLAEDRPFDRAVYRQWRRFFDFGAGMYTDLFVHRLTAMLKATGLLFPARVVGAGGIFLEYDGREVPDVATVAADYDEGVQTLISSTMCNEDARYQQLIRGHNGAFIFGNSEGFDGFDFLPERPQVTGIGSQKRGVRERIKTQPVQNTTYAHFKNWLEAMRSGQPEACNNPPDLGAAAVSTVILGARSYREGKVFFFDKKQNTFGTVDPGWAAGWEAMSKDRAKPHHVAGWKAGDTGSTLVEPSYQKLEGPWIDGKDPA